MQPYFFPYLSYFQLINQVDKFVIFDDVNFIKKGWINRNYILNQDDKQQINLFLKKISQNKKINETYLIDDDKWKHKLVATLHHVYAKAPCFSKIMPKLEEIVFYEELNCARYLGFLLEAISDYMGIKTEFIYASNIKKNEGASAQDRIIEIVTTLGGDHYINPINGQSLYKRDEFKEQGLELSFLRTKEIEYKQFGQVFVNYLSIIDFLVFNNVEQCQMMLKKCELF